VGNGTSIDVVAGGGVSGVVDYDNAMQGLAADLKRGEEPRDFLGPAIGGSDGDDLAHEVATARGRVANDSLADQ
jgi:hypothetical protein